MKTRATRLGVLLAALALVSCGGDSSDSSQDGAQTGNPNPTPPPAASYEKANDFSRDRSFTAIGVQVTRVREGENALSVLSASIDPETSSIGFDFTAATRTYRARYNEAML